MTTNATLLRADATNRGVRSFLTGLAIDVAVGVALVLGTFVVTADSWGTVQWAVLSFSLAKSVVQAVCAYVLRRFLDPSGIPTPLPPEPVAEPANPVDDAGHSLLETILVALLVSVVVTLLILHFR